MTSFAFFKNAQTVPAPFDRERAKVLVDTLKGHALMADAAAREAIMSLAGHSPFLARLMERDADALAELFALDPPAAFESFLKSARESFLAAATVKELSDALRIARRYAAVLVAMADHTGQWDVEQVTGALTRFADVAVQGAVEGLLRFAEARGKFKPLNAASPAEGCGIAILGMGKYGAGELNYSSDIDLVVFFDPDRLDPLTNGESQRFAVKLTKDMVGLLHEPSAEGYVFRVDLRLRPDAGSTQVAVSFEAAEAYYEALGQNWERAAYIKARPVAGDLRAGDDFLETLTPFVWRKYLDFAAIEDIHSILRQIHSHGRHTAIELEGHDVKLGYGGIREIEFFVQTQQLISGGREPSLRGRRTLDMLQALAHFGHIKQKVADDLADTYRYLRHVEHRLQMVEDQQTHKIPKQVEEVARIASFARAGKVAAFRKELTGHLARVEKYSRSLFRDSEKLGGEEGSLVFTGVEDDPATLETLERMGFKRTSDISAAIRRWHHGRLRATRTARARARLTELMPRLLRGLADTADPDMAFWRFDDFLSGLPAGIQLFAMLGAHPELMSVLADILGTAPRLSKYLARHAHVIDAFLDQGFLSGLPEREDMVGVFEASLDGAQDIEDAMNAVRRTTREFNFQTGVQLLLGRATAAEAGRAYSYAAEIALEQLAEAVHESFAEKHGRIEGSDFAIVALGRLGSREMTATSDVDLIFVYDLPDAHASSDGKRPLEAGTYFTRLAQRLVNAITAPTEDGKLYEVDMRLRPSGNKGPVATQLSAFRTYHAESSWTWEHMALTRSRVICGGAALTEAIEQVIHDTLTSRRDTKKTIADVRDMRERLAAEFGTKDPWAVKNVRGGLIDVEFIAQGLQLLHAADKPEVLFRSTVKALDALNQAGALPNKDVRELTAAHAIYAQLDAVLRLAVEGAFVPAEAPLALQRLLSRSLNMPFDRLERALAEQQDEVFRIFGRCLPPA